MAWLMLLFFVFLFLGFPIAFILLAVSLIGAIFLLNNNPQIVVQMMFNGMNSYTILSVPFFIISGGIAARGGTCLLYTSDSSDGSPVIWFPFLRPSWPAGPAR